MLRRAWKPITATAILVGAPAYGFYHFKYKQQTFNIAIKAQGPDGKPEMAVRRFPLLSMQAVDARLRESATYETKPRPGGIVWKHTTATLPSNDPIEDANANAIVQRDVTDPSAPGDLLFFAVMDGHSGTHTSQLLSKVLINAVVLELSSLIAPSIPATNNSLPTSIKSTFWRKPITSLPTDNDPHRVSLAIQNAFTKLDAELINAPLRVLAANLDDQSRKNKSIPDLSQHPLALTTMLPAISGGYSQIFLNKG
jgi:pyruvate dehydrogenase phosphatase